MMKRLKTTLEDSKKTHQDEEPIPSLVENVSQEPLENIILPRRHIPVVPPPGREQALARLTASNNPESTFFPVVAPEFFCKRRQLTSLDKEQRSPAPALKNGKISVNSREKNPVADFSDDDFKTFPETQLAEHNAIGLIRPSTPAPKKQRLDVQEPASKIKLPRIALDKLVPFGLSDSEPVENNANRPIRPRTAAPTKQRTNALSSVPVPRPISPPRLHRMNQVDLFTFRLDNSDDTDASEINNFQL